ncbi:hypothetical protein NQ318_012033 [Aromia moschata]|uniref:Uncharacterized protein n=1 Tax=Aromia moschata TaxID=1265417 RepID=A0AAV8YDC1_9CUCU|nr:hypothetical protein NQ318_012033 [Aromia moschata]
MADVIQALGLFSYSTAPPTKIIISNLEKHLSKEFPVGLNTPYSVRYIEFYDSDARYEFSAPKKYCIPSLVQIPGKLTKDSKKRKILKKLQYVQIHVFMNGLHSEHVYPHIHTLKLQCHLNIPASPYKVAVDYDPNLSEPIKNATTRKNGSVVNFNPQFLFVFVVFVKLACLWITEVIHLLVRCAQLKELLLLPKVCVKTQEPQLVTDHTNLIDYLARLFFLFLTLFLRPTGSNDKIFWSYNEIKVIKEIRRFPLGLTMSATTRCCSLEHTTKAGRVKINSGYLKTCEETKTAAIGTIFPVPQSAGKIPVDFWRLENC